MTILTANQTPPPDQASKFDFAGIRQLVTDEARATDRLIIDELRSDVVLINQIGGYIVNSGGKRLRPLLLLLVARALGYTGQHHITLAAVIEFIHTATLLHDDVVDESTLRRGQETANALWGNATSVLVGDYLYSRAFELMVSVNDFRVMALLSRTTTAIAEGEVLQLLNCNDASTTEEKYLAVISRKTAILFSAAAQLAGILAQVDPEAENALRAYGLHLGIAFQLIDDALDYMANQAELGKNLGDDLADGKATLPLIRAMQQAEPAQADILRQAIEQGDRDAFGEVYAIVEQTRAIPYTIERAREEAGKAIETLSVLPESAYKSALVELAHFSVARTY